jgi:hypothetical protein
VEGGACTREGAHALVGVGVASVRVLRLWFVCASNPVALRWCVLVALGKGGQARGGTVRFAREAQGEGKKRGEKRNEENRKRREREREAAGGCRCDKGGEETELEAAGSKERESREKKGECDVARTGEGRGVRCLCIVIVARPLRLVAVSSSV